MKKINFLKHKDHWFYIVVSNPNIYLKNLAKKTLYMGIFLVIIHLIATEINIKEETIPSNMHGLIGIVIGLSLSFRTATAYDRWWEARKLLAELKSSLVYINIKIKYLDCNKEITESLLATNNSIFQFIKSKEHNLEEKIRLNVYKELLKIQRIIIDSNLTGIPIEKIITIFSGLERIKHTPIPQSYAIHIKLSIFAYLLSLPFGLFFSMGVFSIPLVMLLYFIIAGIEIIATEIENPFGDTGNDLPIDNYKKLNENILNSL